MDNITKEYSKRVEITIEYISNEANNFQNELIAK